MISRTRELLGLSPLPRPVYQPKQPYPKAETDGRCTPTRRHHPLLDNTAITVRRAHMLLDGLCFCCEQQSDGWLCPDCTTRGCA